MAIFPSKIYSMSLVQTSQFKPLEQACLLCHLGSGYKYCLCQFCTTQVYSSTTHGFEALIEKLTACATLAAVLPIAAKYCIVSVMDTGAADTADVPL